MMTGRTVRTIRGRRVRGDDTVDAGRMAKQPGCGGAWDAVVTTILSTDGVARGEREGFWRQALSETFVPMTVGAVTQDRFGDPSAPSGSVA